MTDLGDYSKIRTVRKFKKNKLQPISASELDQDYHFEVDRFLTMDRPPHGWISTTDRWKAGQMHEVRLWRPGSDRRAFIDFENFLTSKTVNVNPLSPTFANICSRIYSTYHLTDDPSVDF